MLDENRLYEEWRKARGTERETLRERLYHAVKKHAASVVWKKFPEGYRDLPYDIAASVICKLESFRGECKFSTWVHEISLRKINEVLRKKIRFRAVFDESKIVEEADPGNGTHEDDRNRVYAITQPSFPQATVSQLAKHLYYTQNPPAEVNVWGDEKKLQRH